MNNSKMYGALYLLCAVSIQAMYPSKKPLLPFGIPPGAVVFIDPVQLSINTLDKKKVLDRLYTLQTKQDELRSEASGLLNKKKEELSLEEKTRIGIIALEIERIASEIAAFREPEKKSLECYNPLIQCTLKKLNAAKCEAISIARGPLDVINPAFDITPYIIALMNWKHAKKKQQMINDKTHDSKG